MSRKKKPKKRDPIPASLFECTEVFRQVFSPELVQKLKQMRRDELSRRYFELGLLIRNFWLRNWSHQLMAWFRSRAYNGCPDTYSAIIIEAMWLELNGTEITEELVNRMLRSRHLLSKEELETKRDELFERRRKEDLQKLNRRLAESPPRPE